MLRPVLSTVLAHRPRVTSGAWITAIPTLLAGCALLILGVRPWDLIALSAGTAAAALALACTWADREVVDDLTGTPIEVDRATALARLSALADVALDPVHAAALHAHDLDAGPYPAVIVRALRRLHATGLLDVDERDVTTGALASLSARHPAAYAAGLAVLGADVLCAADLLLLTRPWRDAGLHLPAGLPAPVAAGTA